MIYLLRCTRNLGCRRRVLVVVIQVSEKSDIPALKHELARSDAISGAIVVLSMEEGNDFGYHPDGRVFAVALPL